MKNALVVILSAFLLFSCRVWKTSATKQEALDAPPGTIEISHNLYIDKTEVTNIDYMEFMFWMEQAYGKNSKEYREILPDSNVWKRLMGNYSVLDTVYLRHPVYLNYPVVGISHNQALIYSSWRSDRVMEGMLVERGIIPSIPVTKDVPIISIFTIEKYFTGQYYDITPDSSFLIYPYYFLPDSVIYSKAATFADSFNLKNYKSCNKKYCDKLFRLNCIENNDQKNEKRPYGLDPLSKTRCSFCKKPLITHLNGNVREIMSTEGAFYGGSFIDSCTNPIYIRKDTSKANSYTGFRNACEYRQWRFSKPGSE